MGGFFAVREATRLFMPDEAQGGSRPVDNEDPVLELRVDGSVLRQLVEMDFFWPGTSRSQRIQLAIVVLDECNLHSGLVNVGSGEDGELGQVSSSGFFAARGVGGLQMNRPDAGVVRAPRLQRQPSLGEAGDTAFLALCPAVPKMQGGQVPQVPQRPVPTRTSIRVPHLLSSSSPPSATSTTLGAPDQAPVSQKAAKNALQETYREAIKGAFGCIEATIVARAEMRAAEYRELALTALRVASNETDKARKLDSYERV